MVDGPDGQAGAGTDGAGTAGGQPAGQGAPGGGNGGAGAGGAAASLDRTKLNPAIRSMSEEEINGLLDTMVAAVSARGTEGTKKPADAQPAPQPVSEAEINEMFDPASPKYNPRLAVQKIAEANYAPLLTDIGRNAAEGLFHQFRTEYDDFGEYEKDIRKALADSGVASPNPTQISTLYFANKGHKVTLKERTAKQAAARTAPPSPAQDTDKPKPVDLDDLEKSVARRMFAGDSDPEARYREYLERIDSGNTTMKVPLSGGVKR